MNKPKKRRNDAVNSDVVFAAGISSDPYLYGGLGFGWDYEWEDTGNDVECGGFFTYSTIINRMNKNKKF